MGNGSFLSETSVSPVVEKKSTERLYLHDHAGNDDLGRCVTRGVRPVPKAGDDSAVFEGAGECRDICGMLKNFRRGEKVKAGGSVRGILLRGN